MAKKKIITPTFYYNDKQQPVLVRLSIEDFNSFYSKLEKLSAAAKKIKNNLLKNIGNNFWLRIMQNISE